MGQNKIDLLKSGLSPLKNMIKALLLQFALHARKPLFSIALIGIVLSGCSLERTGSERDQSSTSRAQTARTALDEYVARPDANYSYHLVTNFSGSGQTTFVLEMTSQAWLTTNEVDRPLWKHWLLIVKPDEVTSSKSLLFINGGANDGKVPKSPDGNLVRIAVATKSVVADLKMVPNQPLVFAGETEGRKEDSLIAYTWNKFLRTGDAKWPARLPMTKAAVRAMDTVTAFCGSAEGGNNKVDGFVVAGGSKRGWTTWTTAAVDNRVVAIMPCVIDLLNIEPSMLHHYAAYGFWAPSVGDYTRMRIMDLNDMPEYRALMKIEEPEPISPATYHAQVHYQRCGRPVFSARFLAVLFQRFARREISSLCSQRRSFAQRQRRL